MNTFIILSYIYLAGAIACTVLAQLPWKGKPNFNLDRVDLLHIGLWPAALITAGFLYLLDKVDTKERL
jgi:hypothetical protein